MGNLFVANTTNGTGGIGLPERDFAGTHRILYGGRRFAVDMGAH
ncbi:MAG TPA: hypothetical protein PK640_12045 [Verrucomicrobiota bacterium]|nr:hypothetical protein [Verrucomicrobiota bacterium]